MAAALAPHAWPMLLGTAAAAAVLIALIAAWVLRGARRRHQRQVDGLNDQLAALHTRCEQLQRTSEQHSQLEKQLLLAKQAAEAAALAKGEFLATMSHEIRTPLNGIIPMLDLVARGPLRPDQQQLLATAASSSQQLLRIVDDILDYSRLEAQALELEITTFNLRELLEGVVQLMRRTAEAKGLEVRLELDPAVRLSVRGDPVRLRQVLGNLLANAIKFTATGRVCLRVQRLGESPTHHQLRLEVVDTGIGIEPEQQQRLFQSFSQADASTTRVYGGTGLGLAICRRIIELMRGRIGVQSARGSGSTFWFEIPLLKIPGDRTAARGTAHATVLLLSADTTLRQRLERVCAQQNLVLQLAGNLAAMLDELRSGQRPGQAPLAWLVIDSEQLRDGTSAVQRALAARRADDALQVLWLGQQPAPADARQHWHPTLPSDNVLHALLTPAASEPTRPSPLLSASPAADAALPTPAPLGLRVLLVEDNTVNLQVADSLLQALGCEVLAVHDGEQALQALRSGGHDVVLMDCQMPVLDGYAATRRWRALEREQRLPHLPIVAITANAMAGDRERCLAAGMDDYLSKPIDLTRLRDCLQRLRKAAAHPPPPLPTPAGAGPSGAEDAPAVFAQDVLGELQAVIGADSQRVVDAFLHDTPLLVRRLQQAAHAHDLAQLQALAHSLKSSSANLGANALSAVARRIEGEARDGTLAHPTVAAARLVTEFARARVALQAWQPPA